MTVDRFRIGFIANVRPMFTFPQNNSQKHKHSAIIILAFDATQIFLETENGNRQM